MSLLENIDKDISLRPVKDTDLDFLSQVYASTREDELSVLDWDRSKKENFLAMQSWIYVPQT